MRYQKIILIILCLAFSASSRASEKDSLEVLAAANNFVAAFNSFDWKKFKDAFSPDASIFYPMPDKAKRISGRKDIEAAWTEIFPEFLDINNKERLQIKPKDLHIQLYGNTAIVSFHLGDGIKTVARRTLVMVKEKKTWKIAHLHASVMILEMAG